MQLTTILARSSTKLLAHLTSTNTSHSPAFLLFALSAPSASLSSLLAAIKHDAPHSVGCLSAPVRRNLWNRSKKKQQRRWDEAEECALALARIPLADCVPFRSVLAGREQVRVGRARMGGWEECRSKTSEKEGVDGLHELSPADVSALLFFSDDTPQGLVRALGRFPAAAKLGIIASSTPFITGRPFTLLHDAQVYGGGAVGVAVRSKSESSPSMPMPTPGLAFPGLASLGVPMTVSKSAGNLIHELDGKNPAKVLIGTGGVLEKEESVYLGVLDGEGIKSMHRILSGGPSRGFIALDAEVAPGAGERVQFFTPTSSPTLDPDLTALMHPSTIPSFRVLCSAPDPDITPSSLLSPEATLNLKPQPNAETHTGDVYTGDICVLRNTFLVASENGFLCGEKGGGDMWRCGVPGAVGGLLWQ